MSLQFDAHFLKQCLVTPEMKLYCIMRDFIRHYKCIKQESLPPLTARRCVKLSAFALCDWSATSPSSQLGINEVGIQKALLNWAQASHPAGALLHNSFFFFFLSTIVPTLYRVLRYCQTCCGETTISHLFEMEKWREENQRGGFIRSVGVCSRFLPRWLDQLFFLLWLALRETFGCDLVLHKYKLMEYIQYTYIYIHTYYYEMYWLVPPSPSSRSV